MVMHNNKILKAFRCKLCKEEFDGLWLIENHIQKKHIQEQIEYLPKSQEKCPYQFVSLTGSFLGPRVCKFKYGHKGDHQYDEIWTQQLQVPPRTGWIKQESPTSC